MPERKLGFFVQIKEDDPADGGINRRNTLSISRIEIWAWRPAAGDEKNSFHSGTIYQSWIIRSIKTAIRPLPQLKKYPMLFHRVADFKFGKLYV